MVDCRELRPGQRYRRTWPEFRGRIMTIEHVSENRVIYDHEGLCSIGMSRVEFETWIRLGIIERVSDEHS